jgi:hypothetical protein
MRKAINPKIKKLLFVDSNINNASPNQENPSASIIHFFNDEEKEFTAETK